MGHHSGGLHVKIKGSVAEAVETRARRTMSYRLGLKSPSKMCERILGTYACLHQALLVTPFHLHIFIYLHLHLTIFCGALDFSLKAYALNEVYGDLCWSM